MRTSDVVKALQELGKEADGLPIWAWGYMPGYTPVRNDADNGVRPTQAGQVPCIFTPNADRPKAHAEMTKDDLAKDASHYFVFWLDCADAELRGQYVRLHEDILTVLGLRRRGDDDWVVEVSRLETCRIRNMGTRHEIGQAFSHSVGQIVALL